MYIPKKSYFPIKILADYLEIEKFVIYRKTKMFQMLQILNLLFLKRQFLKEKIFYKYIGDKSGEKYEFNR